MGNNTNIKDMCRIAMMTVLLIICSWINLPIGPVPFSLQTFAVFSALYLLGGKHGTITVLLYILLGACGLPVFSGFMGGIGKLMGPTGGYIIGFLVGAVFYWGIESMRFKNSVWKILSLVAVLFVCYAFGTAWFIMVYNQAGNTMSVAKALSLCVLPFILPDVGKLALSTIVCRIVEKYI